jgi:multidrug efflux system outer membrane protein
VVVRPSISLPLFTGGSNLAQLRYAEAEKKGLIATYEKSIQSAFKDVADALARRETLSEELDAQRQYVAAEQKSLDIAMKSYQAGVGDYLSVLTAQRTLWSAQATLMSLQQTDLKTGSPSGSRWAAAPVKRRAAAPGLYKESLCHVFPSPGR